MWQFFKFGVLFVYLLGGIMAAQAEQGVAQVQSGEAYFDPTDITVLFAQSERSLLGVMPQLASADVLIVGEYHDQLSSHQLQTWLLTQLAMGSGAWQVGIEWLPYTVQNEVDAFLAGKLSEQAFLQQSDYVNLWGFDYRLVAPIFELAKQNALPIYALNAPKSLTRKVSKQGLAALSLAEQSHLPWPLLPTAPKYQAWLQAFFEKSGIPAERIPSMLLVQSVWDQAMAKSVMAARARQAGPMLVFTGMVHAGKGQGIADALAQMAPQLKVVTLGLGDKADFDPDDFDYYALLPQTKLPPITRLGVRLESTPQTGETGILIEQVLDDSLAQKLGLKVGDRLIELGGMALNQFADLSIAFWLSAKQDSQQQVVLKWQRAHDPLDVMLNFEATIPVVNPS